MRRLIIGIVIGLMLGSAQMWADWGQSYMGLNGQPFDDHAALVRIGSALERMAAAWESANKIELARDKAAADIKPVMDALRRCQGDIPQPR